jgi:hypothetical protein
LVARIRRGCGGEGAPALLVLDRRDVAERFVQTIVVEPADVLDARQLELRAAAPDAVGDQLRLEAVDERLGKQSQIASSSSAGSCRGERCGRLEWSNRQDSVRRASSPASNQRCHQRCAVAGETLKAAAAAFSVIPPAIADASA